MISAKEYQKRLRFKVYIDVELTHLFGQPVQCDEDGRRYAICPAHSNLRQIVEDLHPDWEISEDFVLEDVTDKRGEAVIESINEIKEPEPASPKKAVPDIKPIE